MQRACTAVDLRLHGNDGYGGFRTRVPGHSAFWPGVADMEARPIYSRGERVKERYVNEKVYRSELTPVSFLRRSAYMFPEKTAVVYGRRRYSYSELEERVNRLSSRLRDTGLEKGDRV